jgi:hypothetical protein
MWLEDKIETDFMGHRLRPWLVMDLIQDRVQCEGKEMNLREGL